ncbi:Imm45 family immunity protein [Xenorhabdus sp. PR6a]|uniref:Imm45 family immunity protein n=1 Tax=Xenorhabdus TaxID=626 RepID=UPI0023589573|nr:MULTISPECIES: Imm45 family immunity protein [unclassified Xenorhabdus]MDC9583317.1 Imm45 family immunity protein [Xenorhabdus sp. PR6a]
MIKLIDYTSDSISRGCVFRFPAIWPYEKFVDLLVVNIPDDYSRHGLVVTTGHKAGLLLIQLPSESEYTDKVALRKDWIISNWNKWIYPECDVNDVYIMDNYSAPLTID